jgi:hypothetical protein
MGRPRNACLVAAAIAYLLVALWNFRAVLPAPATLLPENPHLTAAYAGIARLDLQTVLWIVTGNAERILTRPAALRAEGQCHPLPRAYTLGEHMLGEGLLAAVPLALTGDPIAAYNAMLIASVWIAAVAMFLCAYDFTRSAPAAFIAGLLFCLEPARLEDTGHPFVHGDLWAPLALIYLRRTFARGGLWNAVALALFAGLTILESPYALLGVLLVLAAYGAWAGWRYRRNVGRWLPPLLLAAGLVAAVAAIVLRPYLVARASWEILVRSGTMFSPLESYAPGHSSFPGWALVALVSIALADRGWRRRDLDAADPRLALLATTLLVLWCSVRTVPLLGFDVPSPFLLLKRFVPGADAVRALGMVGRVAVLPGALLAGYGVLALVERRSARGTVLLVAALSVVVVAERWLPTAARATFGEPLALTAFAARPPDEDIALMRAHARGARLDIPHVGGAQSHVTGGRYLMLNAFHPGPIAACFNSFPSPLEGQVAALALALPRAAAVDALVALGFETLQLHADAMDPKRARLFSDLTNVDPAIHDRLQLLARNDRLLVFRMQSPTPPDHDPLQLAASAADAETRTVATGRQSLTIAFHNASDRTYAQRAPLAPLPIEARWRDASGRLVHRERTRAVLPIALGAHAQTRLPLTLDVPAQPGTYDLTLHLDAAPDTPLAWTRVIVAPAAS